MLLFRSVCQAAGGQERVDGGQGRSAMGWPTDRRVSGGSPRGAPDGEGLAGWVVTLYRCVLTLIETWTSLNSVEISQALLLLFAHDACGKREFSVTASPWPHLLVRGLGGRF